MNLKIKRLILIGFVLGLFGFAFFEDTSRKKNSSRIYSYTRTDPMTDITTTYSNLTISSEPTIQSIYDQYSGKRYPLNIDIICYSNNDFIDVKFRNKNMFRDFFRIDTRFDSEEVIGYGTEPRNYNENIIGMENFVITTSYVYKKGKFNSLFRDRGTINKNFLKKMTEHDKLLIEFSPTNLGSQLGEFDLLETKEDLNKMFEICTKKINEVYK